MKCVLPPQVVPEDHAGMSHLRAQTSSLAAWTTGLRKKHQDAARGGPAAPSPLPSQAYTHKFLRSVAPRKAFLGMAWMVFSLRSL